MASSKGQYSDVKNAPEAPYVAFERRLIDHFEAEKPDVHDEGFWPSLDKDAPGYIGENPTVPYEKQLADAKERMAAYERGDWNYVGVTALARIVLPIGGGSVVAYTLESPGLWGIESDSGEAYLNEVFEEQKAELLEHIKQFAALEIKA